MLAQHRVLQRGLVAIVMTVLVAGCATPLVKTGPAAAPAANPAPPASSAGAVAARPGDASIHITSPAAGAVLKAGSIKVSIAYSGPTLVPAAQASALTDYHLHYFLDTDPAPYVGAGTVIPAGRPDIVHSAATDVTFDKVAAGDHVVSVVMGGSNHISVNPPLVDRVAFVVQ